MKKIYLAMLIVVLALPAIASAAKKGAADKTYTNSEFKFRLNYPATWNYEESERAKLGISEKHGVNIPEMAGIPKVCNVKFAENLKEDDEPAINLTVSSWNVSKGTKKEDKEERAKKNKDKKGKTDCQVVEQKQVTWGGQKAMLMTTRCPETKKVKINGKKKKATVWKYTTVVHMKHGQEMFNMVGQMMCSTSGDKLCDDLADKGKAAEFDKTLKPVRDKMCQTTKFIK